MLGSSTRARWKIAEEMVGEQWRPGSPVRERPSGARLLVLRQPTPDATLLS